jgi:hypothetical protein
MEKVCTNKNHSYKHNEQINKQNIDNFDQTKYSHLSKVLENVKKKSIYNQPKPYFFFRLL